MAHFFGARQGRSSERQRFEPSSGRPRLPTLHARFSPPPKWLETRSALA